jgi:hypothetical protein
MDFRKITWINWETVCSKKEYGALGVQRLKMECWSLWYRVLSGSYGEEEGNIHEEGKGASFLWK